MCHLVEDYAKEYAKEYIKEYAEDYAKEYAKEQNAILLIELGYSDTVIQEKTGLTGEEITKLREKAN